MFDLNRNPSTVDHRADEASQGGAYCSLQNLMAMRWKSKSLALPSARRVSRDQIGGHQSRFRGRGMEFSEVRTYQAGDDVRSIDWRVTARRQKPHTKVFHEERERPILIVCDQSQTMFFGSAHQFKSVSAAETFALLAWSALGHGDRVGGIVFNSQRHEECKPTLNRKHILNFLSTVTKFNHELSIDTTKPANPQHSLPSNKEPKNTSFKDILRETVRLARPGTLVIFVSDFLSFDEDCEKELSQLALHCDLLFTHIQDPLERNLPTSGYLPVSDGQDTIAINNINNYGQQSYRRWIEKREHYLGGVSRSFRAPWITVSTSEDTVAQLRRLVSGLF